MRGLYLAQRDTLVRAIRDPELEHRHRVVLAEIVIATNSKTGMAFPGYAAIAQATGYSPTTVANTISQLKSWGYLASIKQAAEPGGRALAHYTVVKPTIEQLQAAITAHIEELRKEQWKRNPGFVPPDYKPQELTVRGGRADCKCQSVKDNQGDCKCPPPKMGSDFKSSTYAVSRREVVTGRESDADAPTSPPLGKPPSKVDRPGSASDGQNPAENGGVTPPPAIPKTQPNGKAAIPAALGDQAAFAASNIIISASGKITLGDEFRAELRTTYTDSQIERGIERAPSQPG